MIAWLESVGEWDGRLPAVLVGPGGSAAGREASLRALVARAQGLDPAAVVLSRAEGRPPRVERPAGSGLYLSAGSRPACAALALAAGPVGVDVEIVDEAGEIPWNVLHRREAQDLAGTSGREQALAFARLWSLKEAYLKALGIGLYREPSSFAVSPAGETVVFDDPQARVRVTHAGTVWRDVGAARLAVSAVVLAAPA